MLSVVSRNCIVCESAAKKCMIPLSDRLQELTADLIGPPGQPGIGEPGNPGQPGPQGIPGSVMVLACCQHAMLLFQSNWKALLPS